MSSFISSYLEETKSIVDSLDQGEIERMVVVLFQIRERGGRLFLLGVGGSAGSASHATNDFRKLAGFEAYCPTDNVSELTARINDEGWNGALAAWLRGSRLSEKDGLLVFSVGGGNVAKEVSVNLIEAVQVAKEVGATVTGVVGRDGGYVYREADAAVRIPPLFPDHVTPHTESFHGVIWHLLVTHPKLKTAATKW
ncbi:MAG: SIS domain-containing protein [Planctomycetes bacterium]|nr:SIS domain-containing protein [Planctomycetota bacterium]